LLEPYAPTVFYCDDASQLSVALAADGSWASLGERELSTAAHALADVHPGETIAIAAAAQAIRTLICQALGVPAAAEERFIVVDNAVSVIELDAERRWAVVRVNEGRPLPGDL
jgi:broad specificity phosphatase PhoE